MLLAPTVPCRAETFSIRSQPQTQAWCSRDPGPPGRQAGTPGAQRHHAHRQKLGNLMATCLNAPPIAKNISRCF